MSSKGCCIHWFRKGLRLQDNPALLEALSPYTGGNHLELRPLFILDPWFVKNAKVGPNRWRFLQQSLKDLDDQLKKLGSRLFVARGSPKDVFSKLFKHWNVKKLTFEVDTEPYAMSRDKDVEEWAHKSNVVVFKAISHTLFDLSKIVKENKEKPLTTYQKFVNIAEKIGPPENAVSFPNSIPDACKLADDKECNDKNYDVPTLTELGVVESDLGECLYPGGETKGLQRLDKYVCEANGTWVRAFEKPQTSPNSLKPSTTVLSPYLKFGCISPRTLFWRLKEIEKKGKHSKPPVSLLGQLYWREFYYASAYATPNFNQMKGNPICKQIPWDKNEEYLKAWKDGRTGFPFVDAIMTQLRTEGWIHHLARHMVACFLTRGDLWISWEEGQDVFEEYLLDADWALNAGNWMWLSASCYFYQYFRVYSPIAFGKKTDKHGDYIRKYLPVLSKFPDEYIYEPWRAPVATQKAAGCMIGKDYPKPIVEHDKIHKINIQRMKAAYAGESYSSDKSQETQISKRKNIASGSQDITKFMKKH